MTKSSSLAAIDWTSSGLELRALADRLDRAGTWPDLAQSIEWSLIHLMNTLAAWALFLSVEACLVTVKLWELAQTAWGCRRCWG